jgi:putative membrane protein
MWGECAMIFDRKALAAVPVGPARPCRKLAAALVAVALLGRGEYAAAHSDIRPTPDTVWTSWNPDPLFALVLLVTVWVYLRGAACLWARAGSGQGIHRWQLASFLGGIAVFAAARLSPIDALGGALFSGHMVQHLLIFLVAPLLIVAGRPGFALLWALPVSRRRQIATLPDRNRAVAMAWQSANHWVSVLVLYAGVLWLWHVPALYDAALTSHLVHDLEHASFAAVSLLFWHRVLEARRPNGMGHGAAFLLVFATALHSSALGALLTFARRPLYAGHAPYTEAWGISPLEDQQLAGVLMWIPMGLWFTVTALILIARLLAAAGASVRQVERAESSIEVRPEHSVVAGRS